MPKDNYDTKSLANPITSNIKPLKPLKPLTASKTQKVKAPTKTEQKEQKRLEREALIEQSAQQALDVFKNDAAYNQSSLQRKKVMIDNYLERLPKFFAENKMYEGDQELQSNIRAAVNSALQKLYREEQQRIEKGGTVSGALLNEARASINDLVDGLGELYDIINEPKKAAKAYEDLQNQVKNTSDPKAKAELEAELPAAKKAMHKERLAAIKAYDAAEKKRLAFREEMNKNPWLEDALRKDYEIDATNAVEGNVDFGLRLGGRDDKFFQTLRLLSGQSGNLLASIGSARAGAMVGSAVPGVGTTAGAVGGTILGLATSGSAIGGANAFQQTYQSVMDMDEDELMQSDIYKNYVSELKADGLSEDDAKYYAKAQVAASAGKDAAGKGAMVEGIMNIFGPEALASKFAPLVKLSKKLNKSTLGRVATEATSSAVEEGVSGGAEQLIQNIAVNNATGLDNDIWDNVGTSAMQEAAAGLLLAAPTMTSRGMLDTYDAFKNGAQPQPQTQQTATGTQGPQGPQHQPIQTPTQGTVQPQQTATGTQPVQPQTQAPQPQQTATGTQPVQPQTQANVQSQVNAQSQQTATGPQGPQSQTNVQAKPNVQSQQTATGTQPNRSVVTSTNQYNNRAAQNIADADALTNLGNVGDSIRARNLAVSGANGLSDADIQTIATAYHQLEGLGNTTPVQQWIDAMRDATQGNVDISIADVIARNKEISVAQAEAAIRQQQAQAQAAANMNGGNTNAQSGTNQNTANANSQTTNAGQSNPQTNGQQNPATATGSSPAAQSTGTGGTTQQNTGTPAQNVYPNQQANGGTGEGANSGGNNSQDGSTGQEPDTGAGSSTGTTEQRTVDGGRTEDNGTAEQTRSDVTPLDPKEVDELLTDVNLVLNALDKARDTVAERLNAREAALKKSGDTDVAGMSEENAKFIASFVERISNSLSTIAGKEIAIGIRAATGVEISEMKAKNANIVGKTTGSNAIIYDSANITTAPHEIMHASIALTERYRNALYNKVMAGDPVASQFYQDYTNFLVAIGVLSKTSDGNFVDTKGNKHYNILSEEFKQLYNSKQKSEADLRNAGTTIFYGATGKNKDKSPWTTELRERSAIYMERYIYDGVLPETAGLAQLFKPFADTIKTIYNNAVRQLRMYLNALRAKFAQDKFFNKYAEIRNDVYGYETPAAVKTFIDRLLTGYNTELNEYIGTIDNDILLQASADAVAAQITERYIAKGIDPVSAHNLATKSVIRAITHRINQERGNVPAEVVGDQIMSDATDMYAEGERPVNEYSAVFNDDMPPGDIEELFDVQFTSSDGEHTIQLTADDEIKAKRFFDRQARAEINRREDIKKRLSEIFTDQVGNSQIANSELDVLTDIALNVESTMKNIFNGGDSIDIKNVDEQYMRDQNTPGALGSSSGGKTIAILNTNTATGKPRTLMHEMAHTIVDRTTYYNRSYIENECFHRNEQMLEYYQDFADFMCELGILKKVANSKGFINKNGNAYNNLASETPPTREELKASGWKGQWGTSILDYSLWTADDHERAAITMEYYFMNGKIPESIANVEDYKPMADRVKAYARKELPVIKTYLAVLAYNYKPVMTTVNTISRIFRNNKNMFDENYSGVYYTRYARQRLELRFSKNKEAFAKLMDHILTGYNKELDKYLQGAEVPFNERGALAAIESKMYFQYREQRIPQEAATELAREYTRYAYELAHNKGEKQTEMREAKAYERISTALENNPDIEAVSDSQFAGSDYTTTLMVTDKDIVNAVLGIQDPDAVAAEDTSTPPISEEIGNSNPSHVEGVLTPEAEAMMVEQYSDNIISEIEDGLNDKPDVDAEEELFSLDFTDESTITDIINAEAQYIADTLQKNTQAAQLAAQQKSLSQAQMFKTNLLPSQKASLWNEAANANRYLFVDHNTAMRQWCENNLPTEVGEASSSAVYAESIIARNKVRGAHTVIDRDFRAPLDNWFKLKADELNDGTDSITLAKELTSVYTNLHIVEAAAKMENELLTELTRAKITPVANRQQAVARAQQRLDAYRSRQAGATDATAIDPDTNQLFRLYGGKTVNTAIAEMQSTQARYGDALVEEAVNRTRQAIAGLIQYNIEQGIYSTEDVAGFGNFAFFCPLYTNSSYENTAPNDVYSMSPSKMNYHRAGANTPAVDAYTAFTMLCNKSANAIGTADLSKELTAAYKILERRAPNTGSKNMQVANTTIKGVPVKYINGMAMVKQSDFYSRWEYMNEQDAVELDRSIRAKSVFSARTLEDYDAVVGTKTLQDGTTVPITEKRSRVVPYFVFFNEEPITNADGKVIMDSHRGVQRALHDMFNVSREDTSKNPLGKRVYKGLGKVTSAYGSAYTTYSPIFAVNNMGRDIAERTTYNIGSTYRDADGNPVDGSKIAVRAGAYAAKNAPDMMRAVLTGRPELIGGKVGQYLTELMEQGGLESASIKALLRNTEDSNYVFINELLGKVDKITTPENLFETLENKLNEMAEHLDDTDTKLGKINAARKFLRGKCRLWAEMWYMIPTASMYMAMRDMNIRKSDAYFNTVEMMNLNQKGIVTMALQPLFPYLGSIGQTAGQLVKFYGLSTTTFGHQRSFDKEYRKNTTKAWALSVGSTLLISNMIALLAAAMGTEDDPDKGYKYFARLPLAAFNGLPIPLSEDLAIKIPFGFGPLQFAGQLALAQHQYESGQKSLGSLTSELVSAFLSNISPITGPQFDAGSVEDLLKKFAITMTPAPLQFITEIAVNKDYFGNTINYDKYRKDNERASDVDIRFTEQCWKDAAKAIYDATHIDMTPETVKHIVQGLAVGPLRAVLERVTSDPLLNDEEFKNTRDILGPVLSMLGASSMFATITLNVQTEYKDYRQFYEGVIRDAGIAELLKGKGGYDNTAYSNRYSEMVKLGFDPMVAHDYTEIEQLEQDLSSMSTKLKEKLKLARKGGASVDELMEIYNQAGFMRKDKIENVVHNLYLYKGDITRQYVLDNMPDDETLSIARGEE